MSPLWIQDESWSELKKINVRYVSLYVPCACVDVEVMTMSSTLLSRYHPTTSLSLRFLPPPFPLACRTNATSKGQQVRYKTDNVDVHR